MIKNHCSTARTNLIELAISLLPECFLAAVYAHALQNFFSKNCCILFDRHKCKGLQLLAQLEVAVCNNWMKRWIGLREDAYPRAHQLPQ